MITQEPYFKIVCDTCGEAFPEHESGGGFTLFETEDQARSEVEYHDGVIGPTGVVTCSTCIDEYKPEHPTGPLGGGERG